MKKKISPAKLVIDTFGGVRAAARALGRSPSSVSRWQNGDGLIPSTVQAQIMKLAREQGLDLTSDELIDGRLEGSLYRAEEEEKK